MPITLTSPLVLPNGTRVIFQRVTSDEESQVMTIQVELRTPPATDFVVARRTIQIRNGSSDLLRKHPAPFAGMDLSDNLQVVPGGASTATGYDLAIAAWKAGASPAARRAALEAHAIAGAGWYDASLIGT